MTPAANEPARFHADQSDPDAPQKWRGRAFDKRLELF